jgi:hypothetical protein
LGLIDARTTVQGQCNSPTTTPKFLQSPTALHQNASALIRPAQHFRSQLHFTSILSGPPARSIAHRLLHASPFTPSARSPTSKQRWHFRCRGRQPFPTGQLIITICSMGELLKCIEQQVLTLSLLPLQVRSPHSRSGRGSLLTGKQRVASILLVADGTHGAAVAHAASIRQPALHREGSTVAPMHTR